MPAPPARMRSASVPCGLNSSSSLPDEVEAGENLVLADVAGDHLLDLAGLQQHAQAQAVDAGVVGDDGQILHARFAHGLDQRLRDAAEAEAAGHQRHAVLDTPASAAAALG